MKPTTNMFRYQGLSMWPCFQEGDLLELSVVDFSQLRIGDCVAYSTTREQQAVHRVIGIRGKSLTTRGDALSGADNVPVQEHQINGRVVSRYRFGQECSVPGGLRGRVAGLFYRYAGRIDPNRSSRGGKLARGIRATSTIVLRMLSYTCVSRSMILTGELKITVWELQGLIIGRQDPLNSECLLAWPWSVFVELPKKTSAASVYR